MSGRKGEGGRGVCAGTHGGGGDPEMGGTMIGTRTHSAVLLLAHGSPDSVDQVPDFLRRVTGGRPLPPEAVEEVKRRYSVIGHSPRTEITLRQAGLVTA